MNPLDEIRQLINATRAESAALRRQEQELRDHQERQTALEKARREADAKIKLLAEMESQETQDMWWQMYLSTLPGEAEEAKPIIITKTNILIHKWEQHLMNELEVVGLRRQLQITEAVIQLIK